MASDTKTLILDQHQANQDLNTPLLPQVTRSDNDLAAEDMRSPLDEQIIAGAMEALESGQTHYVDVPGIAPLRDALADYLNGFNRTQFEQGNIVVTAGMQESRFLSIQKIGEMYASVAVPTVVHPGARKALGVRNRDPQAIPVEQAKGYLSTIEAIAEAASRGNRLLYLESPSRLSGAVYTADEVAAIYQLISENDCGLILDQGLAAWTDGQFASPASLDSERARIAIIGEAFSGMGLASWFIGYIAAPEDWVPAMQSQKQIMAICTSTAAQYAALEAGQLYGETHQRQLQQLSQLRADLLNSANAANLDAVTGSAANIFALRLSTSGKEQLHRAGFDFADGSLFGAPDVARLSVGRSTAKAIEALS